MTSRDAMLFASFNPLVTGSNPVRPTTRFIAQRLTCNFNGLLVEAFVFSDGFFAAPRKRGVFCVTDWLKSPCGSARKGPSWP